MGKTNNQFKIDLPKGWEDQTAHFFMGPDDSGVQHTMTVSVDNSGTATDLLEYHNLYTPTWIASLPNAEQLKAEQITLDDGTPAFQVVCKTVPSEKQILFCKRWYIVKGKTGFVITANFSKRTMKTIGVEVERMIATVIAGE